jgi:hypothetical protein
MLDLLVYLCHILILAGACFGLIYHFSNPEVRP